MYTYIQLRQTFKVWVKGSEKNNKTAVTLHKVHISMHCLLSMNARSTYLTQDFTFTCTYIYAYINPTPLAANSYVKIVKTPYIYIHVHVTMYMYVRMCTAYIDACDKIKHISRHAHASIATIFIINFRTSSIMYVQLQVCYKG